MSDSPKKLSLPLSIAQPADVGSLIRELNTLDEEINQHELRDHRKPASVKTSPRLEEFIKLNDIDLLDKKQRESLINWFELLSQKAPIIHISFSSEAEEDFIQRIVHWFRREVHPYSLVIVGLQPNIGVGSVLRTNNKVFDFSLRNRLKNSRDLLLEELNKANEAKS